MRRVYAYYRELGLRRGEFQWMKMAALGGPLFYAGFRDIDTAGDTSGFLPVTGALGSDELRWYEGQFLTMQKAIFSDLAWQHEAFVLGGRAAIHRAIAKLPPSQRPQVMPRETSKAWDDIASGEPDRVRQGTFKLIKREQGPVIQRLYEEMSNRHSPEGAAITAGLTGSTGTPIPGSKTYVEYSHDPVFHDVPKGNIANYPDRMKWIRESLWPAHQKQLQTPGGVEGLLHRDFDTEVARYRRLTPEAIVKGALPPRPTLPPRPILPFPIGKLGG